MFPNATNTIVNTLVNRGIPSKKQIRCTKWESTTSVNSQIYKFKTKIECHHSLVNNRSVNISFELIFNIKWINEKHSNMRFTVLFVFAIALIMVFVGQSEGDNIFQGLVSNEPKLHWIFQNSTSKSQVQPRYRLIFM